MDIWAIVSISLVSLSILSGVSWLALNFLRKQLLQNQKASLEALTLQSQNQHELVAALDKAMALLASRDPMTFQQLQAMNVSPYETVEPYDPSDEGELNRIRTRNHDLADEGDLDAYERDIVSELGIDPEFFLPDTRGA